MSGISEIKEALQHIAGGRRMQMFTAEVSASSTSSTSSDAVVSVKYGEMVLTGVKLFSISAAGGLLVQPAVGSKVTVADMSGGEFRDLVIVKVDNPALIRFEHNGMLVEFDGEDKMTLEANGVSLKSLLDNIAGVIEQLTVATPAGPSGTPLPPTLQALQQFKTDVSKLFK